MTKRKFYKTTFKIVVLSQEPIDTALTDIQDIEYGITDGDWSGEIVVASKQTLSGKQIVDELYKQQSEPGFFELDDYGDDLPD